MEWSPIQSIVALCALSFSCVGIGHIAWHGIARLNGGELTSPGIQERGIIGLVALGCIAMLVNFVAPVADLIAWAVLGSGLIFAISVLRDLLTSGKKAEAESFTALIASLIFYGWWATLFGWGYDSGLYHFQTIEWIRQEAVAAGLANLHSRLGYNSMWLTTTAMLRVPGSAEGGYWLSSALIASLSISLLASRIWAAYKTGAWPLHRLFSLMALVALSCWLMFFGPAMDNDYPVSLLTLLVVHRFLKFGDDSSTSAIRNTDLLLLWLFALYAVMCKVSALPLMVFPLIASLMAMRGKDSVALPAKVHLFMGMMVIAWVVRSIVLSGCLVYPLALSCSDSLSWGAGSQSATYETHLIRNWARTETVEPPQSDSPWITQWLDHPGRGALFMERFEVMFVSVFACSAVLLLIALALPRSGLRRSHWPEFKVLLAASGICLMYLPWWFMTAPDPRFVWGALTALIASIGCLLVLPVLTRNTRETRAFNNALILVPAVFIAVSAISQAQRQGTVSTFSATQLAQARWTATRTGNIDINLPSQGDQCWRAPLPCTPHIDPRIMHEKIGHYHVFSRLQD